jgi:hypothetical protein
MTDYNLRSVYKPKQKRMTMNMMKKMKTWMKIQKEYRSMDLLILPGHCQLFIYDNG